MGVRCEVGEVSLDYESFGVGSAFVALHGMPMDRRGPIYAFEPLFADRPGWRRIYVDLPGHGRSPKPPWPRDDVRVVEILVQFLDTLLGDDRVVLAGDSYGAFIARGLAHRLWDRVDGLCLLAPVVKVGTRQLPPRTIIGDRAEITQMAENGEILGEMLVANPPEMKRYVEALSQGVADTEYLNEITEERQRIPSLEAGVETLDAPTLIITGRQDTTVGYRDQWELLDSYPRATFAVLDRAGHLLRGEQESVFLTLGREWLDRVEERVRDRSDDTSQADGSTTE
jgi:pimeloyl-ACP methyl ester carboxylesterase